MKKLFFFAVAALALAACSKNEVFEPVNNDKAISFQVASYVPQTKANVAFEGSSFTTYAWYHDAAGSGSQAFMTNESVTLKENAAGNANEWTPSHTYFWPKTGDISFYSFAGTPAAASVVENLVKYEGASSTAQTIAITDDPLLASAALHYSRADYNTNNYSGIEYGSHNTDVVGVPTLFHHLLAKVTFLVKFDASSVTDTNNSWELTVNSASLTYANAGKLSASFADAGTKGLVWPFGDEVGWTNPEVVTGSPLAAPAGTGAALGTATATAPNVTATANAVVLYKEISVLPQNIAATGAKIALDYTLVHKYNGTATITERVNLTDADVTVSGNTYPHLGAIPLSSFAHVYDPEQAVATWNMNHKYIYTIYIKPDHTITFSPAVVDWETEIQSGYIYPTD